MSKMLLRGFAIHDFYVILFLTFISITCADYESLLDAGDHCFCKLKGQIGDCSCNVDTVDYFNNMKIYPRLKSLLTKDYFRFYKVNLKKDCPFWSDDSRCAIRHCHVKHCMEEEIPVGLKGQTGSRTHDLEDVVLKYLEWTQKGECEQEDTVGELGYLNTTISEASYEEFAKWQAHDDAQDSFCTLPDDDGNAQYVDLLLNPERFTGYRGHSAHRIWRTIYMENCFRSETVYTRPKNTYDQFIKSSKLNGMCLEKRAFYRVISGLHASINIHLCSSYLLPQEGLAGMDGGGTWGPNLDEFKRRFSPEATGGEGPSWLRNLYFTFLLELRAIHKASSFLQKEPYFTGDPDEDADTASAIADFLQVTRSFPEHYNESSMFSGGGQAYKLKEEFRLHFRNISQIMDCVGCDKCKLWGKLQVQGLGTALKILFSGRYDKVEENNKGFTLKRSEIVALFNSLGRLSTSIYEIETFRELMR